MEPFFEDFYERLSTLHHDLALAIDGLSIEALDWTPAAEVNSLSVLVTHTAGAERYWIGDVAGQEPSGRIRSLEFETSGRTAVELQDLLQQALAHSRAVLSKMSLDDLGQSKIGPRDGRPYSVAWALLHGLEHTAVHLGHAQIGRQLWEEEQQV